MWCHLSSQILVNIGSGDGLLPDSTKPLNQCPFAINWVVWHSPKANLTGSAQVIDSWNKMSFQNYIWKITSTSLMGQCGNCRISLQCYILWRIHCWLFVYFLSFSFWLCVYLSHCVFQNGGWLFLGAFMALAMKTSSNGNIFRITGPLWGEFANRWIPLTKASDAELWCFLWSAPEQTVELTIETQVIEMLWHSLWLHCNAESGQQPLHLTCPRYQVIQRVYLPQPAEKGGDLWGWYEK